jgi:hypothetical protein
VPELPTTRRGSRPHEEKGTSTTNNSIWETVAGSRAADSNSPPLGALVTAPLELGGIHMVVTGQ